MSRFSNSPGSPRNLAAGSDFAGYIGDVMKIESPAFTQDDLNEFFDEQLDRERLHLARRLEEASAGLGFAPPPISPAPGGHPLGHHEGPAHIGLRTEVSLVLLHCETPRRNTG